MVEIRKTCQKLSCVSFLTNLGYLIPCRLLTNLIMLPNFLEIVHTTKWLKSLLYFFRNNSLDKNLATLDTNWQKGHIRITSKNTSIKVMIRWAGPSILGTFVNCNAYVNAKIIITEVWLWRCLSFSKISY